MTVYRQIYIPYGDTYAPCVIVSALINLITSKLVALFGFDKTMSACLFKSVLNLLNRSSNKRDIRDPASSSRLLP